MFKKKIILPVLTLAGVLSATVAKAVCPVCTIAVGTCVGLARWLKIDDRITGLWVGGLIVSLIIWTIDYLNKKNLNKSKNRIGLTSKILVVILYYAVVIVPLYFTGIMGHPFNKCWGLDKLLWGTIIGSIIFIIATLSHNYFKKRNSNKSYFPLQKVAFPVGLLAITSIIVYLIIR
ncbi:MAG: hypothetical protein PHY72_00875 [Candidatus Pacebacteria bacterium]|nr:hypothetical protein [Candidatus Paceibacterota bacterium]